MGLKKKKTRNVVLWCCFAGIRSWGQSSPKGRLLALATHLLGYCKQKVAKNLYPYYFFKGNHYIARFWTRAFPSSRCFHRISKRSSRATWRRLPTLNEPSCFASAWSREVPHPFSCVWLTALGELRPKFLGLSHLSFPLPCEIPNWWSVGTPKLAVNGCFEQKCEDIGKELCGGDIKPRTQLNLSYFFFHSYYFFSSLKAFIYLPSDMDCMWYLLTVTTIHMQWCSCVPKWSRLRGEKKVLWVLWRRPDDVSSGLWAMWWWLEIWGKLSGRKVLEEFSGCRAQSISWDFCGGENAEV